MVYPLGIHVRQPIVPQLWSRRQLDERKALHIVAYYLAIFGHETGGRNHDERFIKQWNNICVLACHDGPLDCCVKGAFVKVHRMQGRCKIN